MEGRNLPRCYSFREFAPFCPWRSIFLMKARERSKGLRGSEGERKAQGQGGVSGSPQELKSFNPLKGYHWLLHFWRHTLFLASASDYQYERQDFCRSRLFDLTGKEESPA